MTPSEATLRERMRLLEGEVDNLRGAVRFLHQQDGREPAVLDESVLERIARLETRAAEQSHTVQQFIAAVARTDNNLQRLAVELERLLAHKTAHILEAPVADEPPPPEVSPFPPAPAPELEALDDDYNDAPSHGWKTPVAVIAVFLLAVIGAVLVIRQARRGSMSADDAGASVVSPMERARMFENERKYPDAESIYRDILKRDPHNADAIRHLASVLFRQNKIEESSVALKQLVVSGSDQ